jgi:hypothetical protein
MLTAPYHTKEPCLAEPKYKNGNCLSLMWVVGWLLRFIVACLLLLTDCVVAEQYVEVTARIDTTSYPLVSAEGVKAAHRSIDLICIVGTNKWRIDNDFSQNSEVKWMFDGTNVYNSRRMTRAPSGRAVEAATKMGVGVAPFDRSNPNVTVSIEAIAGGCPLGDVGVNIPWLAFCSGPYLKRKDRIIPLPVATFHFAPDGLAYSDRTETFKDELGLPRQVDLFTSEALYWLSCSNFYSDRPPDERPPRKKFGLQEGLLKFHYAVIEQTNFFGWSFPLAFEYVQNDLRANGNVAPRYAGIGRVTSLRLGSEPQGVFVSGVHQALVDRRFSDPGKSIGAIVYSWTNASAPPTNDPTLQEILAAWRKQTPPTQHATRGRHRAAVIAVLFATVLVPLGIMLLQKVKKERINRTERIL